MFSRNAVWTLYPPKMLTSDYDSGFVIEENIVTYFNDNEVERELSFKHF